ncbi:FimV/HubP family polar landmark protein [Methyloglobulus sp.]|uniref:FimV/HubP family polar landmark protein n=1 Tax=Methyloglobulus sp. TaxID=2518622 RepID=UPI0039897D95
MRNLTKALTVVSLLAPVSGHSLGIGDIRVRSALNQNLNAEISLVVSRGENPSNIKVNLAPPEKFDEAGVPWSYFLSKIRFQPVVKPNGSMVIKVTSREAFKEPYLNFLLEVSWPKGNLYREFTVLVDPPADYQQPVYQGPVYQEPAYPLTSNYENYPPQQQDYVPQRRPSRHATKPRRSSAGSYGGQIVARRNDTLWNVAERARGAGVSVEQMMIALYEKNPHAFFQQNVNALSAGKTLTIPEKDVVQQTSRREALAEFGRHNEAWNNNRSGVPAGETRVAKEEAVDSQLKLEAPTEATVAANETVSPSSEQASGAPNATSLSQPAIDKESAKETAAPVDEALQSKVAALEKQMAMMQELIALKDKQLAELQNPVQTQTPSPTQAPSAPPAPDLTQAKPEQVTPERSAQIAPPPVKPVPPVTSAKPIVKAPVKNIVQPQPVVEESVSPFLWFVGGIGALSLFGWLWWRKQKILKETDNESMFRSYTTMQNSESTGAFSSTLRKAGVAAGISPGESTFLNDFKTSDFETFESFNVDHSDIDPIAEADVYLAYGRYQQAEELIRQAVKDFPDRDDCKLKLLQIFHANSSKENFENYAMELVVAGKKEDKDFWGKVTDLSRDISTDTELFSSPSPSDVAVFATEPEASTENVLFSVSAASESSEVVSEAEHLGAAIFEVSDVDAEESLFDAPHQQPPVQPQEHEPIVESAESLDDNQDFGLDSFEDKLGEQEDNESIDFDLGPYPGIAKKAETENSSHADTDGFGNDDAPELQLDDLDSEGELETYEFDFNLDTSKGNKPRKVETIPAKDALDPYQITEFSKDGLLETDAFGNDTVDFNFDLEPLQTGFDKPGAQDIMVSDLTDMDELETKLDLAKAYIDMGDAKSAKEIIGQVLEKGSAEQKKTAQLLLADLT